MRTKGWIGIGLATLALSAGCQANEKAPPPPMSTSSKNDGIADPSVDARALAKQRDYKGATKALAKTLETGNGSAAEFSDLAWYAYLAGDYVAAEKAIASGLALSPAPNIKSALLYNRGRVAQVTGKVPEAIVAFTAANEAADNPAALYWQSLLPLESAVVTGDETTLCAALSAEVALRNDLTPAQVACQVAEATALFPKVNTAALAGKVAVIRLTNESGASQLIYALWQQGKVLAVRGVLGETQDDALARTLRRVERGEGYVAFHTEVTGNSRASSYLAADVTFCPDGARPCSMALRTTFEDHAEDKVDDEAQLAWSVAYAMGANGVLEVTTKSGKPPEGLVGEHRIF